MLAIEIISYGSLRVIAVEGDLAGEQARDLRDAVRVELAAGSRSLVLQLDGLRHCDVRGLRELYMAAKLARRSGGDLWLAQPSDVMREQLKAARLDEILRVRESLDEALISFSANASH